MEIRQNCARSKKKLSRIILPDNSSEEENNLSDKRESKIVGNPSIVQKSKQPSRSSIQSKDHSNPVVNQLPKQKQQAPLNLKDTVSDISDFKPQSHNKSESTSPSFTTVDSHKGCRKFSTQLKVWVKVEEKRNLVMFTKRCWLFDLLSSVFCVR